MGQNTTVQVHAQIARKATSQAFGSSDRHITYGVVGNHVALYNTSPGRWDARRIVRLPPMCGHLFETAPDGDRPAETVYAEVFGLRADELRMDDFGNLFGADLGNGRALS